MGGFTQLWLPNNQWIPGTNPKPIIMGLCYSGIMKTNNRATEPWDPNADFSVAGGGLHPWLTDLDINTVIDMSDAEAERKRERHENDS